MREREREREGVNAKSGPENSFIFAQRSSTFSHVFPSKCDRVSKLKLNVKLTNRTILLLLLLMQQTHIETFNNIKNITVRF